MYRGYSSSLNNKRVLLSSALTLTLAIFLFSVPAYADTAIPTSVSATYNIGTGELHVQGTWEFAVCPDSRKGAGFAIFIDGSTPVSPGTGSLDGVNTNTMHILSLPCVISSGPFSDTHMLASPPDVVCVVVYDPHVGDIGTSGGHSDIPAGSDRNKDNSYEKEIGSKDKNSYSDDACTEVDIEVDGSVPEFGLGATILASLMLPAMLLMRRRLQISKT